MSIHCVSPWLVAGVLSKETYYTHTCMVAAVKCEFLDYI